MVAADRWTRSARKRKRSAGICCDESSGPAKRFRIVLYFDKAGRLRTIIPCEYQFEDGVEHLMTSRNLKIIENVRSKFAQFGSAQSIVTLDVLLDASEDLIIEDVRLDLADTIEIAHKAGAPLIKWLLQEHAGQNVQASDDWREGVEMLRYSAAIYLLPVEGKGKSKCLSG
jgi:carbamoyl-phosphate synthase large subunit